MSRARWLAVVALAILGCSTTDDTADATACGGQTRSAIVNGTEREHYLALGVEDTRAIVRLYDGTGSTPDTCTGALIRQDWLITARHCLEIEGLAIDLRLDGDTRVLEPLERAPHPELDVGLIRVAPELAADDSVRPLAIAAGTVDERWLGERVELAGFGTDEQGLLPAAPRYAVESITEIRDTKIAVDGLGRSGACLGDSGGPLLARDERGRPAVLGTLSTGSATCLHRDSYVRVDLLAEWIEMLAGAEVSGPVACGEIGEAGACSFGNALRCRDGVLDATACSGGEVCGWDTNQAAFGCVGAADDPCAGAGSVGVCEATVARKCRDGVVSEVECWPCDRCGYDPATGVPQCHPK
jgi:Trypsin